ncbi:MAG TPA: right-handed parallel beta-helix repeat-containing protein, partial [Chthoniobacterales bacterium]|nr:right-handed parallel beta-helix repeat-containing protein [Chthoniobacterales bacterium]
TIVGSDGNLVQGNLIGLAADGTTARGNGGGVSITSFSTNNTIGGATPALRNVIGSNGSHGVNIGDSNNNLVQGNFIGTDASGMPARGNFVGVGVHNAASNQVLDNVIASSTSDGVQIDGSSASGNVLHGNRIGTDVTGTLARGNGGDGVVLAVNEGFPFHGDTSIQNNRIAFSRRAGIWLVTGTRNAIRRNSIYANGTLGIDLAVSFARGVNTNDANDADTGANALQNYPVLTAASLSSAGVSLTGSLNSIANTTFTLEFFLTPACNAPPASNFGEGETFVGSTLVTTDGSGNTSFNLVLPLRVPVGQVITATATDPNGNTSEFSQCFAVTAMDTDGDGLPDDFESANGLNSADPNDASGDLDGDGASNLAEFYAGTNLNAAVSVLRFTDVKRLGDGFHVIFPTLAGWLYRAEYNNNLADPFGWLVLADQIVGTGSPLELIDPGALGLTRRFYRLAPAVHLPPPNDRFSNASTISGQNGMTAGSNVAASKEAGEPNHAGNAGGASVWFRWVAPINANATFFTAGSSFDTLLGVYTGASVNALTLIAQNDNVSGSDPTSRTTFSAIAGTTYYIAVDGANLSQGNIHLSWSLIIPPPNDNFASAQVISGDSGSVSGDNSLASKEPGEPNHAGNAGGHSLWYSWTAPSSGSVTFRTNGSSFDTIMGVYTGNAVNSLTLIQADDDSGGGRASLVTFNASAGIVYKIAVDGFSGETGTVLLTWQRP